MNPLIDTNAITELSCGDNFSYVLSENTDFLLTEYKVLQNQGNDTFIKCMKMMFNGRVQLYYVATGYKPFQTIIASIDSANYMKIVANILSNVINVKNNGFLSCQNLDISFEKIFVDPSNLQVRLVYLPITKRAFDSYSSFENELRTSLIKQINNLPSLKSGRVEQFVVDLSDGSLSLDDLFNKIKGIKPTKPITPTKDHNSETDVLSYANGSILRIVAMNAPSHFEINVNKDEFVLGRSASTADGAITFNKAIGRTHCKITKSGGQYLITDLSSANGTYVNKARLAPNQPKVINNNDIIRLANSDFQVCID